MLFIHYPKCTTCKRAKKWLDDRGVRYTERHIVEDNPTAEELKDWHDTSSFNCLVFFNNIFVKFTKGFKFCAYTPTRTSKAPNRKYNRKY